MIKRTETRGRKPIYNFYIDKGGHLVFKKCDVKKIRSAFNSFVRFKQLKWKVATWVKNGNLYISRTR